MPQPSELSVEIRGSRFRFQRPADLETLWEGMDDGDLDADERIPYWVEIWPASILLADWITRNRALVAGQRCLDLGCGLGLSASAAAACGARIVGLDYELPALDCARRSATANGVPGIAWLQMDWRRPGLKPERFDCIWGAEIIYERRFFDPLAALLQEALLPGGRIWLAAPRRQVSEPFWERIQGLGWPARLLAEERVNYREYSMEVALWEIRKPGAAALAHPDAGRSEPCPGSGARQTGEDPADCARDRL